MFLLRVIILGELSTSFINFSVPNSNSFPTSPVLTSIPRDKEFLFLDQLSLNPAAILVTQLDDAGIFVEGGMVL